MNMKAVHRIIDSVWTIEYKKISDTSVELIRYSRDDDEGYEKEHHFQKGDVIENANRTVTGIEIEGKEYTVINPKHVFSYRCNA